MNTKKQMNWKDYHASLNDAKKEKARDKVKAACEWSQNTFYTKMRTPEKLKFWEKQLVAKAYGKKVEELFPEPKKKLPAIPL